MKENPRIPRKGYAEKIGSSRGARATVPMAPGRTRMAQDGPRPGTGPGSTPGADRGATLTPDRFLAQRAPGRTGSDPSSLPTDFPTQELAQASREGGAMRPPLDLPPQPERRGTDPETAQRTSRRTTERPLPHAHPIPPRRFAHD